MSEGFPGGSDGKESACNVGDLGLTPGSGRFPGEGNGNPLQYSCWRVPWTEEPGGLQSMGSRRVGQNWATNTHKCLKVLPCELKYSSQDLYSFILLPQELSQARLPLLPHGGPSVGSTLFFFPDVTLTTPHVVWFSLPHPVHHLTTHFDCIPFELYFIRLGIS